MRFRAWSGQAGEFSWGDPVFFLAGGEALIGSVSSLSELGISLPISEVISAINMAGSDFRPAIFFLVGKRDPPTSAFDPKQSLGI